MARMLADHYKTLGVSRSADAEEIRKAYKRLARRYHPDGGGDNPVERFHEVREAYEVLSDPLARSAYDRLAKRREGSSRPAWRGVRCREEGSIPWAGVRSARGVWPETLGRSRRPGGGYYSGGAFAQPRGGPRRGPREPDGAPPGALPDLPGQRAPAPCPLSRMRRRGEAGGALARRPGASSHGPTGHAPAHHPPGPRRPADPDFSLPASGMSSIRAP